ncbi:hypothetical protein QE152_g22479 [Popillia japonica]|uniref:Uncharacterized protein n=1 Tax=Popillia japonica TaxID=7064 RepID=A0AAW1KIR4_POPJA
MYRKSSRTNERKYDKRNVDDERNSIKKCTEKAAEQTIGRRKNTNRKGWYDQNCREKLNEKIKARSKWLSSNKAELIEKDGMIRIAEKS